MGESIVWSISAWIWEICREWGLGFHSAGSLGSLSTSPFSSYSGLFRLVIIGVSCSLLSHLPRFLSQLFSLFSSALLHHLSHPFFIFFYPCQSSFCFLNNVSSSVYNLSFDIVHLYVGWVTGLTRFFDIWHYALIGLVLSFRYLGIVSHRFIHLLPLASITVWVVRPP